VIPDLLQLASELEDDATMPGGSEPGEENSTDSGVGIQGNEWLLALPIPRKGRALFISGEQNRACLLLAAWYDEVEIWEFDVNRVLALRQSIDKLRLKATVRHVSLPDLGSAFGTVLNKFDVIFFYQGLETISRSGAVLSRLSPAVVARVLIPGGACVVFSDNYWSIDRFRHVVRTLLRKTGDQNEQSFGRTTVKHVRSFLGSMGLDDSRLLYLYPDSKRPKEILDANETAFPRSVQPWLSRLLSGAGTARFLHRAFVCCGYHERYQEILGRIASQDNGDACGEVARLAGSIEIRDTSTIMARLNRADKLEILRVPLSKAAFLRQQRALRVTDALREEFPAEASVVPEVAGRIEWEGVWGYREQVVSGMTAQELMLKPGACGPVMDSISGWLAGFHQSTRFAGQSVEVFFSTYFDTVLGRVQAALPSEAEYLTEIRRVADVEAGSGVIPVVWMHGDFNAGNVICDEQGAVKAVLDWDQSDARGAPMVDLLHFVLSFRRRRAGLSQGEAIRMALSGGLLAPEDRMLFDRYADQVGLGVKRLEFWLRVYWLHLLAQHVRAGDGSLSRTARDSVLLPALDSLRGVG